MPEFEDRFLPDSTLDIQDGTLLENRLGFGIELNHAFLSDHADAGQL